MKISTVTRGVAAFFLLPAGAVHALNYRFDDFDIAINNRVTSGIMVRMQRQSNDLLGKTNVPGQRNLCAKDSCVSLTGDPEPNRRLVDAPGAFVGVNGDNGNMNYDRYDIVSAITRLSSDMTIQYGDYLGRVHGILFYDPINTNFQEHHNDTNFQPASTPRNSKVERQIGKGFDLYEAFVQKEFHWGAHDGAISVGYQNVRWGESTLIARNAISEINPGSNVILHTPGTDLGEVFLPTAGIVVSSDLADGVSAEFFYQLKWRGAKPDPAGSFFGDYDVVDGPYAVIVLGQRGEDPNHLQRDNGPIALISSAGVTGAVTEPHEPRDMGQFGLRVHYSADSLLNGTELGFHFLNYHSRYPYLTVVATDASCSREVGPNGRTSDTQQPDTTRTALACQLFNGSLLGRQNEHNPEREVLPIDTMKLYLDYPENIQMYGISFNTTLGGISFAGEYSFRPNLPLQVQVTDVVQTGLQPAFPANDLLIDPTGLLNALSRAGVGALTPGQLSDIQQLASARFPGANTAVPSFLKKYRGYGAIQPHQVIPGYERFAVGQFDLTALKVFSTNPFGADQILTISEVGFTHVYNMPKIGELQMEDGNPNRTHASIGQDEKGPNDFPTLTPHRQTRFADGFAWGVREVIRAEYNDVVFGWTFKPQIILQWDIGGTAPLPIQNFIEGRKQFDIGTDINITQAFSARVNYQIYTGGGRVNTLKDRDNIALSFAYSF